MKDNGEIDLYDIGFDFLAPGELEAASVIEEATAVNGLSRATRSYEPLKAPSLADYEAFATKHFGTFSDIALLITAFTHRSFYNENKNKGIAPEHNERLEFLGDAVLYLAVGDYLYRAYADSEGLLTQWRTALVRNSVISEVAEKEGFEQLIRLSPGLKNRFIEYVGARRQLLANCYEAVIGATYLTMGNDAAQEFVRTTLISTLDEIMKDGSWRDPKGRLQELLQRNGLPLPEYREVHREGPQHNHIVVVGIYLDDKLVAEGAGRSTKEGQIMAATNAFDTIAQYMEKPRDPKAVGAY